MNRPTSHACSGVTLGCEPSGGPGPRWVVTQAEAELVERYGALHASERDLDPAMFDPPAGAFVVARSADGVVGGAGVRRLDDREGEVRRLWVDPGWRGGGVGRSVMGRLEQAARDLGLVALRLATGPRQPEAVALYEATDWTRQPRDPDGSEAIRFTKGIA